MEIIMNDDEKFILEVLQSNGQGFIVGGWCRDKLLGVEPKDTDFVTDIEYDRLLELFNNYKPKEVGKHFGVLMINLNGVDYEIAKMRIDKNHTNNRNQLDIEFVSDIEEDVLRRDLTIGGILYDGDKFIDCVGGIKDLENKTIRFIGNPISRIVEDPLRLMRAIRFATRLGFDMHKKSMESIKSFSYLIRDISKERVRMELDKILLTKNPKRGIELLHESGILKHILPEVDECFGFIQNNPHHDKDLANHILTALDNTESDLITRLATLFHDIGKIDTYTMDEKGVGHFFGHEKRSSEIAESIMKDLKYDNNTIKTVFRMIQLHMNKSQRISDKAIKRFMNKVGIDNLDRMFDLMRADIIAHNAPHNFESLDALKQKCKSVLENNEPTTRFELSINGKDLINTGRFKQGKEIGAVLNKLMEIVLENPDINDKEKLLKLSLDFARTYRIKIK